MEVDVYADVYFLINLGMDAVTLSLTARFLRLKPRTPRLLAAAALGAVASVVSLFTANGALRVMLFAAPSLFCPALAFGFKRYYPAALLLFVGSGTLLGGLMTAFYTLLNARVGIPPDEGFTASVSAPVFAAAALICSVGADVVARLSSARSSVRTVSVELDFGGGAVTLEALCDSGNLLREPISGRPVLLAAYTALSEALPPGAGALTSGSVRASDIPAELRHRLRAVPVNRDGGSLMRFALLPDRVVMAGAERQAVVLLEAVERGAFGGCDALAPSSLT